MRMYCRYLEIVRGKGKAREVRRMSNLGRYCTVLYIGVCLFLLVFMRQTVRND